VERLAGKALGVHCLIFEPTRWKASCNLTRRATQPQARYLLETARMPLIHESYDSLPCMLIWMYLSRALADAREGQDLRA
jgi:hypothetical protein